MRKFILKKDTYSNKPEDYTIAYKELLNAQQLDAVFYTDGAALVVAGAGTGKTRTLVHRVARLIESGVSPSQILLLTFTRRAANEMLERATNILDQRCKSVTGGTFHFYCSHLLHRYAERIGYPNNFTIIDTADALEILQFVRSNIVKEAKIKRFPNKGTLLSIISTAINKNMDVKAVVMSEYSQFYDSIESIEKVALKYQEYKERNFVMDFDDLLIKTKQLLEQHNDIRIQVATNNRFV